MRRSVIARAGAAGARPEGGRRRNGPGRWLPIHHALDAEQRQLTIDAAADGILDALPDHTRLCQDVLVGRLRRREYRFYVGTTGSCFNAITGLKRELRGVADRRRAPGRGRYLPAPSPPYWPWQ